MAYRDNAEAAWRRTAGDRVTIADIPSLMAVIETPIVSIIQSTIQPLETREPEYEPLLFDKYIFDASTSADRALSIRREIQGLEADAIRYAREYKRFESLATVQEALEQRSELIEISQQYEREFSAASQTLSNPNANDIATISRGLSQEALANSTAHRLIKEAETARKENVKKKWEILRAINKAEVDQHSLPGGALNLKERKDRLVSLMKLELTELYKKCKSVSEGMRVILELNGPALPTTGDVDILDKLVIWIRDVFAILEKREELETSFILRIPLMQPFNNYPNAASQRLDNAPPDANALVSLLAANTAGMLSFRVDNFLRETVGALRVPGPAGSTQPLVKNLRVLGVGVSIEIGFDLTQVPIHSANWTAVVFPPERPRALAGGVTTLRPPLIIGALRPRTPTSEPNLYSADEIRNAPAFGEWKVKLLPSVTTAVTALAHRSTGITDVVLLLQVSGLPNQSPGNW